MRSLGKATLDELGITREFEIAIDALAYKMSRFDPQVQDDMKHEAIAALLTIPKDDPNRNNPRFLYVVIRNKLIDLARSRVYRYSWKGARQKLGIPDDWALPIIECGEDFHAGDLSLLSRRALEDDAVLTIDIAKAIDSLEEPDRTVVIKNVMWGIQQERIGDDLGLSRSMISKIKTRALETIKEYLQDTIYSTEKKQHE